MGERPEELRKARIQSLLDTVKQLQPADFNQLIALYSIRTGLTEISIKKMLKILVDANLIEIADSMIKLKGGN